MKKLLITSTIILLVIAAVLVYILYNKEGLSESSQQPARVAKVQRKTGYTLPNGDIAVGSTRTLVTNAQVVSVDEPSDGVFPETSVRIKIGYYDNSGKIHVYPARMGGSQNDGTPMRIGFCLEGQKPNCWAAAPQDVLASLVEGEIYQIQLIYQDNSDWEGVEQVNKYSDFYTKFKSALATGDNYPEPPSTSDFLLQISQVRSD